MSINTWRLKLVQAHINALTVKLEVANEVLAGVESDRKLTPDQRFTLVSEAAEMSSKARKEIIDFHKTAASLAREIVSDQRLPLNGEVTMDMIQAAESELRKEGQSVSLRAVAEKVGCSHTVVARIKKMSQAEV